MKEDDVLGGFSAVFESINRKQNDSNEFIDSKDPVDENDTALEDLFNKGDDEDNAAGDNVEDNNAVDPDGSDNNEDNPANATDDSDSNQSEDMSEVVSTFFDAIAETAGWEGITNEEKPKTVEDLVSFMQTVIESNSTPSYANDDVAALDEYVRNGGSMEDYISKAGQYSDPASLDMSIEENQKKVLREFLKEKGFTDDQIRRKISKYEDADILADEAADAVDSLSEIREQKKKALLEEQKTIREQVIKQQQDFYNSVVSGIEALTDIRGIQIPKSDKAALIDYMFKVEPDGKTRYAKDYASSPNHLIESAYFTMKGDALISTAKRSGETSAIEKLKNTLNSTKVSGSRQRIDNRSAQPLWSAVSSQLMRRPQ